MIGFVVEAYRYFQKATNLESDIPFLERLLEQTKTQ